MSAPVVALDSVSKGYRTPQGEVTVLRGVNLAIEAGEKVSLIGPSGSGKSTLLGLMSGLLRPDAGSIDLDGAPLSELSDETRSQLRAQRIGIALQSDNLIPFLSAIENIQLALGFGARGRDHQWAMTLLEQLGVGNRCDHFPRQLSGGEAQRVALAVALANEPGLLLADEMVSALDTETAGRVVSDVFSGEMAVLFVTHDLALADRADRRLRLHDQRIEDR